MRQRKTGTDIDDIYDFEKGLGQGSMGAVAAIKKKSTGKLHVLKTIQMNRVSEEFRLELKNEIQLLMKLDHPNIIKPLELFERGRQMFFVMEYNSGGDLYERMPYSEKQAADITNQITSAIRYLHSMKVCHRDLKFENIMFESKAPDARINLIDFGLSTKFAPGKTMKDTVGTLYSMAPEVLSGKGYTQSSDMWSVGVLAFMLLAGHMPFESRIEAIVMRKIERADYSFRPNVVEKVSAEAKAFVANCIKVDPSERLGAAAAQNQPWLVKTWEEMRRASSQLSAGDGDDLASGGGDLTRKHSSTSEQMVTSLKNYGQYGKLKKAALMVVAHSAESDVIRDMRDAFLEIDTSKEGFISLAELQAVLKKFDMASAEVDEIFKAIDVDGSGKIGYTEFLAATVEAKGHITEEQLLEAFDRLDADDSGFITQANMREILGTAYNPEEVKTMIKDADFKKNGMIDQEEFVKLMTSKHDQEAEAMAASVDKGSAPVETKA